MSGLPVTELDMRDPLVESAWPPPGLRSQHPSSTTHT